MTLATKKTGTLVFLFFIFLLTFVSAGTYIQPGGANQDYQDATGTTWPDPSSRGTSLTDPSMIPLVYDLDSDGSNEIIYVDNNAIVARDTSLNLDGSFLLNSSTYISQPIITLLNNTPRVAFYIDGSANDAIVLLSYSSGTFTPTYFTLPLLQTRNSGKGSIVCRGTNETDYCLAVMDHSVDASYSNQLYATFNYSGIKYQRNGTTSGSTSKMNCQPAIGAPQIVDYDSDGTEEVISSYFRWGMSGGVDDDVVVEILPINRTGQIGAVELNIVETAPGDILSGSTLSCVPGTGALANNDPGMFLTFPYTHDWLGDGGQKEILIGFHTTNNAVLMHLYRSTGVFYDDYPETSAFPGKYPSPIVRADVDSRSGTASEKSGCVMISGYENYGVSIICASPQHNYVLSPETQVFVYDPVENVTGSWKRPHNIMHSGEYTDTLLITTPSLGAYYIDPSEFVTPVGILIPDDLGPDTNAFNPDVNCLGSAFSTVYGAEVCPMTLFSSLDATNLSLIPVDAENIGSSDLIGVSNNALWYFDDGFNNLGCDEQNCLGNWSFNPCLNQGSVKQNETLSVRAYPYDGDGDSMQSRAEVYIGEAGFQNTSWSANLSAGSSAVFSFNLNQTTTLSALRIYTREGANPSIVDYEDFSFSVASSGVETGECVQTGSNEPVTDEEAQAEDEADVDPVTELTNTIGDIFNIGSSSAVYLLILIIIVAVIALKAPSLMVGLALGGAIIILGIFLGVSLGILGYSIVIGMILFMMVLILLYMMFRSPGG